MSSIDVLKLNFEIYLPRPVDKFEICFFVFWALETDP
jgi:hypothetical protein